VNVCAGHNVHADQLLRRLDDDSRVEISGVCLAAAARLRDHFGLEDASPFSYVAPPSPVLNVYCEPRQYLSDAQREAWEPVVFFGSVRSPSDVISPGRSAPPAFTADADLKLYVSFGTIVWRYFAPEAIACLRSISAAVARRPEISGLISLGGAAVDPSVISELQAPNVRVESYVDQWEVLARADAFITHHGLNSTHEAVFQTVPMLSYPFFGDQPALAHKAQDFGLAIPLVATPRSEVRVDEVHAALDELHRRHDRLEATLGEARDWELDVIDRRPAAVRRILTLV
jgi:UDP:flavonoid glycosyltransferase YjiC (YdhE family)